jgi:hypothetical protein
MAPDASPLTSPHHGASPVPRAPPCVLSRFLSPSGRHNKPNVKLRVKSRKPWSYWRQNMQFSMHNRVIYGKLGGKFR